MKKLIPLFFFFILSAAVLLPQEPDAERKPLIAAAENLFGWKDAMDISLRVDLGFEDIFWNVDVLRMDYWGGPFTLTADLMMNSDRKYAAARVLTQEVNFADFYFFMNEGGIAYTNSFLSLRAGRFRLYDEVDSPYSLFINSLGHSANTMKLRFESPRFIYQSQWIEATARNGVSSPAWNEYQRRYEDGNGFYRVNNLADENDTSGLSDFGFPDRGVNYKIYAVKINDWRLGFLDAAVYTGRSFDPEYFLNPIPQYFIQYIKGTPGRPWATASNENNLIGLFWDIDRGDWSSYVQVLVDDFSLGFLRFIFDSLSDNPWKTAWALGGRIKTPYGRFGFHHAGALKYTFEPIGTDDGGRFKDDSAATAYGYTYYPETRYFDDESGGSPVNILIEDNLIGYKYGENNLAFQVDYQNTFNKFLVNAELEFVLAGANSPANPWQDYDSRSNMYNDVSGSQLFNDNAIEKRLELRVNVSRKLGSWTFFTAAAVGGRFNKLKLVHPDPDEYTDSTTGRTVDDEIWIWKASDDHEPIFRFSIGAKYTWKIL